MVRGNREVPRVVTGRAGFRGRIERAFAREQLRSQQLAMQVLLVVLPLIAAWVTIENGFSAAAFFYPYLILLAALVTVPYWVRRRGLAASWLEWMLAPLYIALVTYLATTPPPSNPQTLPLPVYLGLGNELYLHLIVVAAVFTFNPRIVLWTGFTAALAWSLVTIHALIQPDTLVNVPGEWTSLAPEEQLRFVSNPHRVHIGKWIRQVVTLLVTAGMLAAFVRLCRGLVLRQAAAERERANLSRYFSANLVEELAQADEPLGTTRAQQVAVLFADIVGFTTLSEKRGPEEVIALLREFHGRMERAVFEHHGTVDKYIGDAIMATFGTPTASDDDPVRALRCARAMVSSITEWNRERVAHGAESLHLGIGIHYGPVVLGDIGGEQRLEFAVIGDTVNVASRLERLTRELGTPLVISGALVDAVRARNGDSARELAGFARAGDQRLRGRGGSVDIWRWTFSVEGEPPGEP